MLMYYSNICWATEKSQTPPIMTAGLQDEKENSEPLEMVWICSGLSTVSSADWLPIIKLDINYIQIHAITRPTSIFPSLWVNRNIFVHNSKYLQLQQL
jgi:hypothetical protein